MELDYDWTYQSDYQGTITGATLHETDQTIDYAKLSATAGSNIAFYDENCLWEDEMGDNGTSVFNVKTRVMDFGIYILVRSFSRVDNVIFRSLETRYYIEFDTVSILRETRRKEDSFELVAAVLGRHYRDDSMAAEQLSEIERTTVIFL